MTNEELISRVAGDADITKKQAKAAISTIFDALKEPTEEMEAAAIDARDDDCLWQAMLSASPLAPTK